MIDQEAKTQLETTGGRDGQVPMQELNQQHKTNMITPEHNESTTGRLDQPNPKKAERMILNITL